MFYIYETMIHMGTQSIQDTLREVRCREEAGKKTLTHTVFIYIHISVCFIRMGCGGLDYRQQAQQKDLRTGGMSVSTQVIPDSTQLDVYEQVSANSLSVCLKPPAEAKRPPISIPGSSCAQFSRGCRAAIQRHANQKIVKLRSPSQSLIQWDSLLFAQCMLG